MAKPYRHRDTESCYMTIRRIGPGTVGLVERLIVDGMNVLGSRPDGWWRDRPAAMARLTRRLERLAAEGVEVTVVFDGRPHRRVESAADAVAVGFAPGGPDAADREIVARVRADPAPESIVVVTSDRRLRSAVKAASASSVGAGELLRRLEALERE
jgi:predicted RNA-binding protein with PIN domain